MAFPHSHKTVLILDHGPAFAKSSQDYMDFDVFTKSRSAPGMIPLAPIAKSLWTCNVEACLEYSRIVYDIFPQDKLIAILTSDTDAKVLTTWKSQDQSLQQQIAALGKLMPPNKAVTKESEESTVMHGLNQAIELLCEPTDRQKQILAEAEGSEDATPLVNKGRIVCLTSFKSDKYVRMLENCVVETLNSHNKLVATTDALLPVDHCELVLVHVVPLEYESRVTHSPLRQLSPVLSSEVHEIQSGKYVAAKMVGMAINHYNLASTTVSGIPMKEEQNASSSANYDVELLHQAEVHSELVKTGGHADELIIPSKEGLLTSTVSLKWCTPKSNVIELHQCTGAYRITPVDVNSRPSSCLTNFLLNGRAVMLEQPRKSGSKFISHMLCSHGGEIYIHTLNNSRSPLEDPPSISEGCGGRITDYRISDFGELMKETRLAPAADASHLEELPIERAKAQLERMTRHWPLVIGDTIIFNMLSIQHNFPLPSLIIRENLSDEEVLECKKAIYYLVGMEERNEPLPLPSPGSRGKGPKRDEQYRLMWNELERLVRAHVSNSPAHKQVLECLRECRGSGSVFKDEPSEQKPDAKEEENVSQLLNEFDRYQQMTTREKQDFNEADIKKDPDSPPNKKFKLDPGQFKSGAGGQSLLSMWTSRISALHSVRCPEFSGRQDSVSSKAELYLNLKEKNQESGSAATSSTLPSALKKS